MEEINGMKLSDNFYLESDEMNLILREVGSGINPRTRKATFGIKNTTSHRTMQQVFNHILEKTIYDEINEFTHLEDLMMQINKLTEYITKFENAVDFIEHK